LIAGSYWFALFCDVSRPAALNLTAQRSHRSRL
jgi:hypothetical protein